MDFLICCLKGHINAKDNQYKKKRNFTLIEAITYPM